jgi:hypothetical protein
MAAVPPFGAKRKRAFTAPLTGITAAAVGVIVNLAGVTKCGHPDGGADAPRVRPSYWRIARRTWGVVLLEYRNVAPCILGRWAIFRSQSLGGESSWKPRGPRGAP